jgi:hypothetical protein
MTQEKPQKFEMFNDKYASLFGKRISSNDGAQYWKDFIDKSDLVILAKVLDTIAEKKENIRRAEGKAYITAPKMPEVKHDYFDAWRDKQQNERRARGVDGHCGVCMGNGWIYCVFDEKDNAIDITKSFHAPRHAGLQIAACECDRGRIFDENANNIWRHNNAKCGFPESLPKSHEHYIEGLSGAQILHRFMNKNWINQVKQKAKPALGKRKCVKTETGFTCGVEAENKELSTNSTN